MIIVKIFLYKYLRNLHKCIIFVEIKTINMEKINGKEPGKLYYDDELTEIARIYGDKFPELWESLMPHLDENIDYGKFIVYGTVNKTND